jgi:tetratricopeptide (TPR) repeat protein
MFDTTDMPSKQKEHHSTTWMLAIFGLLFFLTAIIFWTRIGHAQPRQVGESGKYKQIGSDALQPSGSAGIDVSELLKQAEMLRVQMRFREAEVLLTKAVQTDRDDNRVWRALATLQRDMSAASLKKGSLLSAAQEADRARESVRNLSGVLIDPKSPSLDTKILIDEEAANAATVDAVRAAIDLACQKSIKEADKWAKYAYKSPVNVFWVGFRPIRNDRNSVVEGLKHLKMVVELGNWASDSTRMAANEIFSKLKKLVEIEEWNDLLARAGFDPGSRDMLKKWGLE